ncbi:hypothetical protein [Paenibacillus sp. XY044]|uniref:hypothetical protein n=1 Tax=Paenibacillus sp. XY044 TaxID=2026089 RepID=UPI000B984F74|nr:hypothetical protein [Paenibacillus sp. XY044]OZB98134.1 hypothetical protein CJP46_02900 [Paenibacillus sp. XY044]
MEEQSWPKLVGDRVRIKLRQRYTANEIREFGCHPNVDGKTGTVLGVEDYWDGTKSYTIKLDEVMYPHTLHKNTEFEEPFDIYIETSDAIELI